MPDPFIAQMDSKADLYERLAKSLRATAHMMREADCQEALDLHMPPAGAGGDSPKSATEAIRLTVDTLNGGIFDSDEVIKSTRVMFPQVGITRDAVNFALWKMSKKGNLAVVQKGGPHKPAKYRKSV